MFTHFKTLYFLATENKRVYFFEEPPLRLNNRSNNERDVQGDNKTKVITHHIFHIFEKMVNKRTWIREERETKQCVLISN